MKGDGSSRTWHKLNAPYHTADYEPYGRQNINVSDPISITIEAGARFEFGSESSFGFWDGAKLNALGTASQPIVFSAQKKTAGSWVGMLFGTAGASTLDHIEVSYGGAVGTYAANLSVFGVDGQEPIVVKNSRITHSQTCGIVNNNNTLQQSANTFANNPGGDVCP